MRWFIAIIFVVHCAASAESNSNAREIARKCERAIAVASSARDSIPTDDLNALCQSELIVARCYFIKHEIQKAEEHLKNILFLKPEFELDAFETPPPLVALFEKIKNEIDGKTRELKLIKEEAQHRTELIETEVVVRKMSPLMPLVPFGLAQFEYGSNAKGILIAVLEGSSLLANVASYWAKRSLVVSEIGTLVGDQGALANYNLAQGFQFASLGLFALVYIFGTIDGFVHRNDVTFESESTQRLKLNRDEFLKRLNQIKNRGS